MQWIRCFPAKQLIMFIFDKTKISHKEIIADSESVKEQFDSMQDIISRLEDISEKDQTEIASLRAELESMGR